MQPSFGKNWRATRRYRESYGEKYVALGGYGCQATPISISLRGGKTGGLDGFGPWHKTGTGMGLNGHESNGLMLNKLL